MSIRPMISEQVMIIVGTLHSRALAACDMPKGKMQQQDHLQANHVYFTRSIDSSLSVKSYHRQVSVMGEQPAVYLLAYFLLALSCK